LNNRLFYLDAMRGILMMLGVVLHSAQLFSPERSWLLYHTESSPFAGAVASVLHVFRMPAFFVVSGYFCILTLKKYGGRNFLRIRLRRIAVPLICTGLTLNVIQAMLLDWSGWKDSGWFNFFVEGDWVSHLWFLNYLIVYFLVASLVFFFSKKSFVKKMSAFQVNHPERMLFFTLFLMPLYTIGLRAAGLAGLPLYWDLAGIIQGYDILFYLQFFAFGYWLQTRPRVMFALTQLKILLLMAIIALGAALDFFWTNESTFILKILDEYLHMLVVWFSVALCFGLFYRLTNDPSPIFRFLSDASYSVYLVHHLLVVVLGLVLLKFQVPPLIGFLFTLAIVMMLALAVHKFAIAKSRVLTFMFNGK